ncbi:porphobilinogen deaminase [Friedmanniomyces endolithicus]|nr:porphobilinogen deaminase [Friedmanniomyces endolithicus]KAK0779553.1 porphobilinogen deaminase [Friedmanniomyces endolithicus]KAK0859356.1 porphobilinogen deaminase [Friedmanniomyces endolithicus]KAK0878137.1 porphobilinogen deaminase [Friedmanniomyces endolithicus]KAK0892896.1 porphobilinogen deaminase [Friedmanniomyces endolithicus]
MAGLQDAPLITDSTIETSVPACHTAPNPSSSSPQDATTTFHIGTRSSLLARVQTDIVLALLRAAWPKCNFETHFMKTAGDNNQTTALYKFNDKALWTQELEVLLQEKKLDLIVHSLKDMPTQLPIDLELGCVTARGDPRDAFVMKASLVGKYKSLAELPEGSVVGTSSLRRTAQLKRSHPHLRFADVRGNMGTRLSKLDNPESEYSALILAVAGLDRLGMSGRITTYLSKADGGMLYAVGQGALGIEARKDDAKVKELLSVETEWVKRKGILDPEVGVGAKPAEEYHNLTGVATSTTAADPTTSSNQTNGSEAHADNTKVDLNEGELTDELIMRALVVSLDGFEIAEVETRRRLTSREEADEFGWEVARQLVAKGADKILEGIGLNRKIIGEQNEA